MNLLIKGGTINQKYIVTKLVSAIVAMPEFPNKDIIVYVYFHSIHRTQGALGLTRVAVDKNVAIIELDSNLWGPQLVDTLAHEMIHVYQFFAGDLDYHEDGVSFVWRGVSLQNVEYDSQPHEILAFGLSQYLLETLQERAA